MKPDEQKIPRKSFIFEKPFKVIQKNANDKPRTKFKRKELKLPA